MDSLLVFRATDIADTIGNKVRNKGIPAFVICYSGASDQDPNPAGLHDIAIFSYLVSSESPSLQTTAYSFSCLWRLGRHRLHTSI